MQEKVVTMKDVARMVGVSRAAVSAALSGKQSTTSLPEATRERIVQAAKQLNYTPNIIAHSMRHQRTFLLGVLLLQSNTAQAAGLIRGIQEIAVSGNYAPIVFSHKNTDEEIANFQTCLDRRVDGLILTTAVDAEQASFESYLQQKRSLGIPLVEIFGRVHTPWVLLDHHASGRIATEHLLKLGHRRIALLTHEGYEKGRQPGGQHWNAWEQYEGYEQTMRQAGLNPYVITHPLVDSLEQPLGFIVGGIGGMGDIIPIMKKELARRDRPTAVICYYDLQAYAVIHACQLMKLSVPDQLSVIGHLDLDMSPLTHPPLTTFRVSAKQVGRHAARLIFRQMDNLPTSNVSVAPIFVERQSTAPPPEDIQFGCMS